MKEQWTNEIRKKLKDYEAPVIPEGLWDDINCEMSSSKVVPFFSHWRKVCAAVALLLVSLSSSWFLLNNNSNPEIGEKKATLPPVVSPKTEGAGNQIAFVDDNQPLTSNDKAIEIMKKNASVVTGKPNAVIADTISAEMPLTEDALAEVAPADVSVSLAEPRKETMPSSMQYGASTEEFRKASHGNAISLAFNASGAAVGSIANGSVSYNEDFMYNDATQSDINSNPGFQGSIETGYQGSVEINKEKHHRPITVGLQVGMSLSNRLSVNTGVNYTYLYSEFDKGVVHTDQKLHYVGVPAMLNYSMYQNDVFGAYIGAGGSISFGVSGKADKHWVNKGVLNSTSEKLQNLPIYFSSVVSLGVQLNMFKGLNLYAEPSLQYNIPSSSKYTTFYDKHHLLFDLRFGLRWNLYK